MPTIANFFMAKIKLSDGRIQQLIEESNKQEDNATVPFHNEKSIKITERGNYIFQITDLTYCYFYNVIWITIFDGSLSYRALLDELYWSESKSFLMFLKISTKDKFIIEKGDIFMLEEYAFKDLVLCNDPLYSEIILKLKKIQIIPTNKNLDDFHKFKLLKK